MNNLTNVQQGTEMAMANFMGGNGVAQGFENIDQDDLMLGKIKLLQATSDEVASRKGGPGQFYNSQTGTSSDEVICYFMKVSKPRSCFERPYKKGSKPKCRSIDGVCGLPAEGGKRSCKGCPEADWDAAKAAGKTKPDCTESYAWLGALMDGDIPFRFTCSGENVKITRAFINTLIYKKASMFCHVVKLTSVQTSNDKGTFYTVKYELVESYTPDEFAKLDPAKQQELVKAWTERQNMATSLATFFDRAIEHDTINVDSENVIDGNTSEASKTEEGQLF